MSAATIANIQQPHMCSKGFMEDYKINQHLQRPDMQVDEISEDVNHNIDEIQEYKDCISEYFVYDLDHAMKPKKMITVSTQTDDMMVKKKEIADKRNNSFLNILLVSLNLIIVCVMYVALSNSIICLND